MRLRGETNFKDCGESRRKGQVQQGAGRWSRNLGFPTKGGVRMLDLCKSCLWYLAGQSRVLIEEPL